MIEAPRRASRCHVSQTAALGSDGAGVPHAVLCCAGPLECAAEAGRKRVRERPQGLGGDEGERPWQDRRRGGGVQRQLARLTHRKPHGPLTRGGCGARAVGPGHSRHGATLLWLLRCRLLRIGCRFSCPWNSRLPLEQPRPGGLPSASILDDDRTVHMPDSSRQAGHAGLRQNCVAGMCSASAASAGAQSGAAVMPAVMATVASCRGPMLTSCAAPGAASTAAVVWSWVCGMQHGVRWPGLDGGMQWVMLGLSSCARGRAAGSKGWSCLGLHCAGPAGVDLQVCRLLWRAAMA